MDDLIDAATVNFSASNELSPVNLSIKHRKLYKWMSLNQMKQALRSSQLLGVEPLNIFKNLIESKKFWMLASGIFFFLLSKFKHVLFR